MSLDASYVAQALIWGVLWGGLGIGARVAIARVDQRRRRSSGESEGTEDVR